jgi:tetratricopeptide (TPR) repeat protein
MAKKKKEELPEIGLENVEFEDLKSKGEEFFNENKNVIIGVISVLFILFAGYYYYSRIHLPEQERLAQDDMFMAVRYFEQDSLDKAINGYGTYLGFIDIIDDYGSTKVGNQAKYYLGVSYLKKGMYNDALDMLGDFSSDDTFLQCVAIGAKGDAYSELGEQDKALDHYVEAADCNSNDLLSPVYLKKAGMLSMDMGQFQDAVDYFNRIKTDFKDSQEAADVDRFIAMAQAKLG